MFDEVDVADFSVSVLIWLSEGVIVSFERSLVTSNFITELLLLQAFVLQSVCYVLVLYQNAEDIVKQSTLDGIPVYKLTGGQGS